MDPVTFALAILIGLAAGVASGLFGVGGGTIMVPALIFIMPGTTFLAAKAVSLAAMLVGTLVGIVRHQSRGAVDVRRGVILGVAGAAGAALAVVAAEGVADVVLRGAFGGFLVLTSLRMMRPRVPLARALSPRVDLALIIVTGFGAGIIAGFFGVGGGIVMVPAMVFAGVAIHVAVGTSLIAILINALVATTTHLGLGYWRDIVFIAPPLATGAIVGAFLGADLAHRLNADRLKRVFAVFLILVGGSMLYQAARIMLG